MNDWENRQRKRAADDLRMAKWRAKQDRESIVRDEEKKKWPAMAQLLRDNSLCLCDVEDAEVPCWQHAEDALLVLWVASGGVGPLICGTGPQFCPFFRAYDQRQKFLTAFGLPARIEYKPDARGYRLYTNNNSKAGRPKAIGKDLPAAIQRYRVNIAIHDDPDKRMVEKTYKLHKTDLDAHQDAVTEVMRKVQAGKSSSRSLPMEDFGWAGEISAPAGSSITPSSRDGHSSRG